MRNIWLASKIDIALNVFKDTNVKLKYSIRTYAWYSKGSAIFLMGPYIINKTLVILFLIKQKGFEQGSESLNVCCVCISKSHHLMILAIDWTF